MIVCCTQIIALLQHHQRRFLLQQMGSSTETHQPDVQTLEYSALNLIFHQMSPLRALEPCGKGGRKSAGARGKRGHQE